MNWRKDAIIRPTCPGSLINSLYVASAPMFQMPRVLERRYLRFGFLARLVFEKDVVVAVAIERRVEIDEIDGFRLYLIPQYLQIVAVVEVIHRISERAKKNVAQIE